MINYQVSLRIILNEMKSYIVTILEQPQTYIDYKRTNYGKFSLKFRGGGGGGGSNLEQIT